MGNINSSHAGRVVVVTGGGNGIGAATSAELARNGATVIVADPGVGVQGEPQNAGAAAAVAAAIAAAGGTARASSASVTDADAIAGLFADVVAEFGRLDAVVNPAGILRYKRYQHASQDDWQAVLDVHLNGYLNVLSAALPIMATSGFGRIVGFASGAGLARTSVDGVAYGCAKRSVGSLTWELAAHLPVGVAVNALSPIAGTRMVREGLIATGTVDASGLDLSAMPQAEDMAPAATLLSSPAFDWCAGQVIYSAGSEMCVISPPRVIEIVRTRDVADFAGALGTISPVVLAAAEGAQRTSGGSNPRFGNVFIQPAAGSPGAPEADSPGCLIVCDEPAMAQRLAEAVSGWGLVPIDVTPPPMAGLFESAEQLLTRAAGARRIDAVVVAVGFRDDAGSGPPWQQVVDAHRAVPAHVVAHASWLRAAATHAASSDHPMRTVHLTSATSPAGRTAAQALAQMARSVNDTPSAVPLHCFAVALETTDAAVHRPAAQLVARLARADDTLALRGAELFADADWIGIRSHPAPMATISFGGPAIPDWVDGALRRVIA